MQGKSKKIKVIGWLFAFLVTSSYAVDDPKYLVRDIINERKDIISYVDTNKMARIILGKRRNSFTKEQMEDFVDMFEVVIAQSYNRFILNSKRKIDLLSTKYSGSIAVVSGRLDGLNVKFMLYLDKQQEWKIYNLVIDGINYGILYRTIYKESIEMCGVEEFLLKLRKKLGS